MPDRQDSELSNDALAKMRPMSMAKRARIVSGLSQAEFARVYGLPIGTIRDWEQGRSQPDAAGIAYLTAIVHDPEAVARAYGAAAE